ncbi:ABC-2 family transporter protein [Micromonospora halotolerans]|uniref:ABC-2 family transporter protein n=1 Tax=Micromonospora halotolerans TaxID=709879 RepID=A0ABY9ZSD8_9ACTN|nr:ABC-2 family transporter protein [Micromonospora halotolerans]WNM37485.1 ABC-2 family transporter protein [Micromonospora halotolerans]
MGSVTATVAPPTDPNVTRWFRTFGAIAASGFRRHATYRQAAVAGVVTNTVFGFLRCYIFLAVAGAAGTVAGYDRAQLGTFVWAGQGLLAVIAIWGWTDLADRIRTGEIAADLLRPVHPVTSYLATDLGRAGFASLARLLPPVVIGPFFFAVYLPRHWATLPLFGLSVLLSVVVCFACRYLVNATAYWLEDVRGPMILWTLGSGVLAGLYFPLGFLPSWVEATLRYATPFPSLLQVPLDVLVEREPMPTELRLVGLQVGWAVLLLALCRLVQRRAEHRLVVQGG